MPIPRGFGLKLEPAAFGIRCANVSMSTLGGMTPSHFGLFARYLSASSNEYLRASFTKSMLLSTQRENRRPVLLSQVRVHCRVALRNADTALAVSKAPMLSPALIRLLMAFWAASDVDVTRKE